MGTAALGRLAFEGFSLDVDQAREAPRRGPPGATVPHGMPVLPLKWVLDPEKVRCHEN